MKKSVRVIAFIIIFVLLFSVAESVLKEPVEFSWARGTGMKDIHHYHDQYDVCFFGTSLAIANLSCQEMYEKYGIAGICIGGPDQNMYLTRYVLEEVLNYQKHAIFVVEVGGLFFREAGDVENAKSREDYIVHTAVDGIRSYDIKARALEQVKQFNPDLDVWNYYLPFYHSHVNWEGLSEQNFQGYTDMVCMNGNIALFEIKEGLQRVYGDVDRDVGVKMNRTSETAVREMAKLCHDAGVELVLIRAGVNWSQTQHRQVEELARACGVEFYDINDHIDGKNYAYNLDLNDVSHMNLGGAVKVADLFGQYLKEHYDLPDRRGDPVYQRYENQTAAFHTQLAFIQDKQTLLSATTFDDYLRALARLDRDKNIIFIAVYDEASGALTETSRDLMKQLGLERDMRGRWRASYAAVIDGDQVLEKFRPEFKVELKGTSGEVKYKVVSGGAMSGTRASIVVNGAERAANGRGFNIVVYDRDMGSVVSSVFFDTCAYPDPVQGRVKTGETAKTVVFEYASAPNVWQETQPEQ